MPTGAEEEDGFTQRWISQPLQELHEAGEKRTGGFDRDGAT